MSSDKKTQLRLDQARWWALSNQPFYGALAMSLPDVINPLIATANTDGQKITWNPSFVETLTDEELRFVLLHETLHCAHQHMWRLPEDQLGNVAGDHEINLTLAAITGIKMPEGGLADPQYEGLACEEILSRLAKEPEKEPEPEPQPSDDGDDADGQQGQQQSPDGQGGGGGKPGGSQDSQPSQGGKPDDGQQQDGGEQGQQPSDPCGTFSRPASTGDPAADAQMEQQIQEAWESRVMQAAQVAQAAGIGDVPGDLQRVLDRIRHQGVDWRREMVDFVKDASSARNDWSRSSRRHAWQPVIYPRRYNDDVGTVIFARDTSGSISDKVCAEYTALITDCVGEMGCRGLVVDCDTAIQGEYEVNGWEQAPLTAKGGGGTRFQPVFDKADEMVAAGERIAGIVYLTDMMAGDLRSIRSEIPTLWLATSDYGDAPFGRKVRIEVGR